MISLFINRNRNLLPQIEYAAEMCIRDRTPAGILNSIGLENPGVDVFIKYILPQVAKYETPLIVTIAGSSVEDYGEISSILDLEENVACLLYTSRCV